MTLHAYLLNLQTILTVFAQGLLTKPINNIYVHAMHFNVSERL